MLFLKLFNVNCEHLSWQPDALFEEQLLAQFKGDWGFHDCDDSSRGLLVRDTV